MDVRSAFDLSGRTALVTGGNQGLGKAFAIALAQAGARVSFSGRNAERNEKTAAEAAAAGHQLHAITADITRAEDVERMTAEAIEALGHIDILVNNAGTCHHGESWTVTEEQWDDVFDLNVKALWACSLAVGAHMRERGSVRWSTSARCRASSSTAPRCSPRTTPPRPRCTTSRNPLPPSGPRWESGSTRWLPDT